MQIEDVTLYRLSLPLVKPYRLSYRTFTEFEPIVARVRDSDGRIGWGEGHISPGSSSETREGGWSFCNRFARQLPGMSVKEALAKIAASASESPVAATALTAALEMLEGSSLLTIESPCVLPLLVPVGATEPEEIKQEVSELLSRGFKTFKVKVGKDVDADLDRVARIQEAADGRATLRIDANRGYSVEAGRRFASNLDPSSIQLFEQPCAAEDWAGNAEVAAVSKVPLMLDEPICDMQDIDRAASIEGVGYCKLKLKRFSGLYRLRDALNRVTELGMTPVLGDGLSSDITGWMEASIAARTINTTGEYNGFLKTKTSLFANPMPFHDGSIHLRAGFSPQIDQDAINRHALETVNYGGREQLAG
jgi:L-alanine-DL-glutamate epimerase-like enolase superfamily enzyme